MKFEFVSGGVRPRAVCRDVGKIDKLVADRDFSVCSLAFWVDGKRYCAHAKPTYPRRFGGVLFNCSEDGGVFELSEPPKSGVLDDWRTPSSALCSDPRILCAFILYAALRLRNDGSLDEKGAEKIAAIIADVPTRAEALEWLKTNRFPTEWDGSAPRDVSGRLQEGETEEDFIDYLLDPRRLAKCRVRLAKSPR